MKKTLATLCLLFFSITACACQLGGYQATYKLYRGSDSLIGTHTETLQLTSDKSFIFSGQSQVSVLWFKDQFHTIVKGRYANNAFQPRHYQFSEQRKNTRVSFGLKKGTFDPFSYILAVRSAILTHANNNQRITIRYDAAGHTQTIDFHLNRLSHQVMNTALGKLDTVEISSTNKLGVQSRYWLAKKYGYLPVLIAQYKNNKIISVNRIESLRPANSIYCAVK